MSQELIDLLQSYHWPGNVRELESVIECAMIISLGKKLKLDDGLPASKLSKLALCNQLYNDTAAADTIPPRRVPVALPANS